ncbi:MAG TPA: hypothetical protein VF066_04855 [Thermoleophilaceae bacterium]
MSETSDLIAIHGAIDRAVADDRELRAEVARILPIYVDEDARWFDEFEAWTIERRAAETEGPPFPSLDEALKDLGETPARGRQRARRLFAIALTARAFPELLADEDGRSLLTGALRGVNALEGDEGSERLLELLVDERLLYEDDETPRTADAWWENLLVLASEEGLLADAGLIGPRPCTPHLVTVDMPDGSGLVTALETEFETDQIPFDKAIRFLDPVNWPDCNDFWCQMTKIGGQAPGPYHYHEVVSTDCAHKPAAWTIEAYLDFRYFNIPGQVAIAAYGLTEPHPLPGDDVVVDGGSLIVREIGTPAAPAIRVKTTKRIRFNRPFDGLALALMMCPLGYASVAEDLVFTCAALGDGQAGTAFPGAAAKAAAPGAGGFAGEWEALVKAGLDECVDNAQASSKKMADGSYTPDDFVKDMAAMWSRAVRDGAKAFDLAARGAQKVARGRVREG